MRLSKLLVAAGIVVALTGFLLFGLAGPTTTLGQQTDVPAGPGAEPPASFPDGDGTAAEPPASLPDTGEGSDAGLATTTIVFASLLAAAGVSLAGAGFAVARYRRQ